MKLELPKTRRGKLVDRLKPLVGEDKLAEVLLAVDEYEKDNLSTIEKLNRKRLNDINRIKGGLKQSFHAHPVLRKELIGSIAKRIYGALLENKDNETRLDKVLKWLKVKN